MARIIFDLDGTLVHSAPSLAAAANALTAEFGRPPLALDTVTGFVGNGVAMLIERVMTASGGMPSEGLEACKERFEEIYTADPVSGTEVFAGVRAALVSLAEEGHGLAVCTQKPTQTARIILERLDLMPPITGLTGGGCLDVLKPDPRMLHHAAGQLPPGEIVFVGDSETDAATAKAAGVPFLLFTRGYCHVPRESLDSFAMFDDYNRLPDIVHQALEERASA